MELFFVTTPEERSRILGVIDQNKATITDALNELDRLVDSDADKAVLAELKAARGRYVASFTRVAQQLGEGQRDTAAQTLKMEPLPAIDGLQGHVDALNESQRRQARDRGAAVQSQISEAVRRVICLGLVCLAAGILLASRTRFRSFARSPRQSLPRT
ncbi:MCP four helix bundle domain-containing protein [Rhodoferax koreense]|nr:MCP four helix bundle domain-containing protein [Rhodoferax koreense]